MVKKIILFSTLISINFSQFCAEDVKAKTVQDESTTKAVLDKAHLFLFLDQQTSSIFSGNFFVFDATEPKDSKTAAELLFGPANKPNEINSMFGTSDILFVAVIATDTPSEYDKPDKNETPDFERHGDLKIGIKPKQIPKYFPLSVFYKGKEFIKDGDVITLIKDVILDNGKTQKIEFVFTFCQKHGLSRKKINIDDLLRKYLAKLLKTRYEQLKEVVEIPGLITGIEEHELGLLPTVEVSKLIQNSWQTN